MSVLESESRITVRVYPNAARNEVVGLTNELLQVKVSAPPVKGKANIELIAFLSKTLDVSKSRVGIIKGLTARNKVITIHGLSREDVMRRLLPP